MIRIRRTMNFQLSTFFVIAVFVSSCGAVNSPMGATNTDTASMEPADVKTPIKVDFCELMDNAKRYDGGLV